MVVRVSTSPNITSIKEWIINIPTKSNQDISFAGFANISLTDIIADILNMSQMPNIKAAASPYNFYIPFYNNNSKVWFCITNKSYDPNIKQHFQTIGFDTDIFDNLLLGAAYSNGSIETDSDETDKSIYSLYGKLTYRNFNFYNVISIDKNDGLINVNNISDYLGASYIIDFGDFEIVPKIGLLTVYNSDGNLVIADSGFKFKADITDYLEFTNEIKLSEIINGKKINESFFDNLITNETGLNIKYKNITLGLIYRFANNGAISSDRIGFNFIYNF